jgi:hypothetical protein
MNVTVATEKVRQMFGWNHQRLEAEVAAAPVGADGALFLPYLNGRAHTKSAEGLRRALRTKRRHSSTLGQFYLPESGSKKLWQLIRKVTALPNARLPRFSALGKVMNDDETYRGLQPIDRPIGTRDRRKQEDYPGGQPPTRLGLLLFSRRGLE